MKKATIFIVLDEEGMNVRNFIYMLMEYQEISQYEIFLAYAEEKRIFVSELKKLYGNWENICWMEMEHVSQKSRCYNKMSGYASTNVYFFLNVGILPGEKSLECLLRSLEEEEEVLAVQPLVIQFHSFLVESTGYGYIFPNQSAAPALLNRSIEDEIVNISGERVALDSALLGMNRLVFEELNGFNENIADDLIVKEITLRISKKGYKNYYNHQAKVYNTCEHKYQGRDFIMGTIPGGKVKSFRMDMENLFSRQISHEVKKNKYTVINFSSMSHVAKIMKDLSVDTERIMNYSKFSNHSKIEFDKIMPFGMVQENCEYLYFVNNFHQIKNNHFWFGRRECHNDLLVDLSGNCMKVSDLTHK